MGVGWVGMLQGAGGMVGGRGEGFLAGAIGRE